MLHVNRFIAVIISLVFISFYPYLGNGEAEKIFGKVVGRYNKHPSISYKIIYRQKFFTGVDTIEWRADCKLVRSKVDSLFGGYVWFKTSDSIEKYCNEKNIFVLDHSKRKISEYVANKAQSCQIKGNSSVNVININFLKPGQLLEIVRDTTNKVTVDSINNHFIITILYPPDQGFSEMEKKIWVEKNEFVIDKITFKAKFQGNHQYNEWNLSEIKFDNVSVSSLDLSVESYKKKYKLELFNQSIPSERELIKIGTKAPFFKGVHFQEQKSVSYYDYAGKFLILDFSYMSCLPCIKAIPHLSKLQKEYGDKNVLVLAINSKDVEEKNKKRLSDFINNNSINYPVILTKSVTDSIYGVSGYPTIYAIDKKGRIVYSQMGYSENLADTLQKIINQQ